MTSWDRIIEIHQNMTQDYPSGERGFSAIRFLVNFFVKNGCDRIPNRHPLTSKFFLGAEFNYQWLIQYALKIEIANSIPGFSEIAPRITNPKTFLNANSEMEVALKFHLADLKTSFIPTDFKKKTPDIRLEIKDTEYTVEISSLNPPDHEGFMWSLHSGLSQLTIGNGLTAGGFINKIPNPKVQEKILSQVKKNIAEIHETKEAVKISEPGFATIYIAPQEKIEDIPSGSRGIFRIAQSYRRTTIEKIERKLHNKYGQLFSSDNPTLLYLYSYALENESLYMLFENVVDNMEVVLPSYPKLLGVVLTVPHLGFEVISGMISSIHTEKKENKVYFESEIGKGQYESSLLWKNFHSDFLFPFEIEDAIKTYSDNIGKLLR